MNERQGIITGQTSHISSSHVTSIECTQALWYDISHCLSRKIKIKLLLLYQEGRENWKK